MRKHPDLVGLSENRWKMAKKWKKGYKSFGANCRIVQDQRYCTGAFNTQILIPHTANRSFACDFGPQKRIPCGFALYGAVTRREVIRVGRTDDWVLTEFPGGPPQSNTATNAGAKQAFRCLDGFDMYDPEGHVRVWTILFVEKLQLWNTLIYMHSTPTQPCVHVMWYHMFW